jgi:MFS family permease
MLLTTRVPHLTPTQAQQEAQGPPYAPSTAGIGGLPDYTTDIPITSVFMLLYVLGAATHMTILQLNRRRGHKFLASGALFGFCMTRLVACAMRIAWATHSTSVPIAIAANVFLNAGVIIIIIVDLIFAQRILRASYPKMGWSRALRVAFRLYFVSIVLMLAALITSIVQQSYTLDGNIRRIDRDIQLVGTTYNSAAAFAPVPVILVALLVPRLQMGGWKTKSRPIDKPGVGRWRTKVRVLLLGSLLISLGAGFRCGVLYAPRPANDPAWYHSKACFYCFNFTVEILVIYTYAIMRVDRLFHIPDGAKGVGSYSGRKESAFGLGERDVEDEYTEKDRNVEVEPATLSASQWEAGAAKELESENNELSVASTV